MSQNDTQTAIEHGAGIASKIIAVIEGGTPGIVLPSGFEFKDLSHTLPKPLRKKGVTNVGSVKSFVHLVNEHKGVGTKVYADVNTNAKFLAVIDDHHKDGTGWGEHRVVYNCPLSPEWKAWINSDGKQMSQEHFAMFIEENNLDIRTPEPAAMLEISRTLQAKKNVEFASGIRLDNGQTQLTYNEEVKGTAGGKGQLAIPETFTIGIPVYVGGAGYAFEARFRYRIKDAHLTLWYDIIRPHKVLETAFAALRAQVETETSLTLIDVV